MCCFEICELEDQYGRCQLLHHKEFSNSSPLVSVILSVYNGAAFLEESINSVLEQTVSDLELLIVDDGSTDSTLEVLNSFAKRDQRIKIVHQPNMGLTKSLNRLLNLAKGQFVARQDADDLWCTDKLSIQLARMKTEPSLGVLGTSAVVIYDDGSKGESLAVIEGADCLRKIAAHYNPLIHSSVLIRSNLLHEHGYYDVSYDCAQDYELWLRLLSYCEIDNIATPLCFRRVSENMISNKKLKRQRFKAVSAKIKYRQWNNGGWGFWYFFAKDSFVVVAPRFLSKIFRLMVNNCPNSWLDKATL